MIHNKYTDLIIEKVGMIDNLVGWSKTYYYKKNPKHLTVFNSNIVVNGEKVWYGDIDLSISKNDLQSIAKQENVDIYVIYESDGRFENEEEPYLDRPVAIYRKDGTINYIDYVLSSFSRYEGLGTRLNRKSKICI